MPLFEFRCEDCGEEFERLLRSSSPAGTVACPRCSSEAVTKKFSSFACSGGSGGGRLTPSCAPGGG